MSKKYHFYMFLLLLKLICHFKHHFLMIYIIYNHTNIIYTEFEIVIFRPSGVHFSGIAKMGGHFSYRSIRTQTKIDAFEASGRCTKSRYILQFQGFLFGFYIKFIFEKSLKKYEILTCLEKRVSAKEFLFFGYH